MTFILEQVPSMDEVLRGLPQAHVRAMDKQISVSALLEAEQPSDAYEARSHADSDLVHDFDQDFIDNGLDAFGRVLEYTGIITHNQPAAGMYATQIGRLLDGEHVMPNGEKLDRKTARAIGAIWAERQWRRVKYLKSAMTRGMFTSEDDKLGDVIRPWSDNSNIRDVLDNAPRIALALLVAQETAIQGRAYRSVYVDETALGTFDYKRVPEGSEIPTVELRTHETEVRLHKRGRAINWSYEAAREMGLDKFQLIVQKMALDVEYGKIVQAMDVLINGDGNPGTGATVVDLTDMDNSLTAGDPISLRALLRFKKEFRGTYMLTTILGNIDDITDLEMTEVGLDNTPLVALPRSNAIGQLTPVNNQRTSDQLGYGDVDPGIIPADNYLAFDRRWALERISQIGATVSEAEDFITNQTSVLTFTDVDGFAILFPKAVKLLNTNA